jgi:hypothetical protein
MTDRTASEVLFERFCADTGMPCVRLEPDSVAGRRTPDYELSLQEPPILVEVKQIDPNPEDEARLRAFADTGEYNFDGVPGDRLRGRISKAGSQLRARARPDQATLVVVYNNVDVLRGYTDPHAVMSAMYGLYRAVITTTRGVGARIVSVVHRLGGGRSTTPEHNTRISGLAVLFDGPEGPYLVVYHNKFAAVAIRPEVLRRPRIHQRCVQEAEEGEGSRVVRVVISACPTSRSSRPEARVARLPAAERERWLARVSSEEATC